MRRINYSKRDKKIFIIGSMYGCALVLIFIMTFWFCCYSDNTISPLQAVKNRCLQFAYTSDKLKMIDLFLRLGANPDMLCHVDPVSIDGRYNLNKMYNVKSLLQEAVFTGSLSRAELLLKYGADPNYNNGLYPPLANACADMNYPNSEIKYKMIELLLKYGAEINTPSVYYNGKTPLHIAIQNNEVAIVKLFLENGGNIYITDSHGNNGYWYATNSKNPEMIKLIDTFAL